MSLEPSQPSSGGERPAFTGRFPTLSSEAPSGQESGERRPTFSARASGPAEYLAPATVPGGAQAGDLPRSGDETAEPGPDTSENGTSENGTSENGTSENGTAGGADSGADSGGASSDADATAALRPAIRHATSGTDGTAGATATTDASGTSASSGADVTARADQGSSDGSAGSAASRDADVDVADGPLLSDTVRLRSNWDRVQAGFVDDPEEAVADAADLVERTVQALVVALRQRQRTLRALARRGPADGQGAVSDDPAGGAGNAGAPAGGKADGPNGALDTEHLRRMMLRYRALFNQVCRP